MNRRAFSSKNPFWSSIACTDYYRRKSDLYHYFPWNSTYDRIIATES
jgi:hypothetical protein